MKKYMVLLAAILALLLFAAQSWALCSGEKTGDAEITNKSGYLVAIFVSTDGTNKPTLDVYDNTANYGTKLLPSWTVTTDTSTDLAQCTPIFPVNAIPFEHGIYIDVTLTSGTVKYEVYYEETP